MSIQDLGSPPPGHKFVLNIEKEETSEEQAARLAKEKLDADAERKIRWITFLCCLLILVVMGILSLYLVVAGATAEDKRAGLVLATAILSGSISFVVGRQTAKK